MTFFGAPRAPPADHQAGHGDDLPPRRPAGRLLLSSNRVRIGGRRRAVCGVMIARSGAERHHGCGMFRFRCHVIFETRSEP